MALASASGKERMRGKKGVRGENKWKGERGRRIKGREKAREEKDRKREERDEGSHVSSRISIETVPW